jgi:hypothetical protein
MMNENLESQIIGTLLITDKHTGEVLVQKRNAIHAGNMAYVLACSLSGSATNLDPAGGTPSINWMAFGNGGSSSTTTLAYRSPRVSGIYDQLPITASNATLYSKTYQQRTAATVFFPGQLLEDDQTVPSKTSKINFRVELDHNLVQDYIQLNIPTVSIPESDSSTDANSIAAFTFDEIGLLSGVTNDGELDETRTLLLTHVTFHPVLLSVNRTIVIDYTITIQIN